MSDLATIREQHKDCTEAECRLFAFIDDCGPVPCHVTTVLAALDEMQGRLLLLGAPDRPMSKVEVDRAMSRAEEVILRAALADADLNAEQRAIGEAVQDITAVLHRYLESSRDDGCVHFDKGFGPYALCEDPAALDGDDVLAAIAQGRTP